MKKSIVLIIAGLVMMVLSGQTVLAAPPATDLVCIGCVNDTDIAAGAVTDTKLATGAVSSGKIADGAVTDAKIIGPISVSKLEKPANVVVVAKAGGDYTSISAALAAINPTADNPYVVKVMPGVYNECGINMKSYVHLQGAGKDATRVICLDNPYYEISCDNVVNVTISGFSLEGTTGVRNYGSSPTIMENRISSYYDGNGINNYNSSPIIKDNVVEQCESNGINNSGNSKPIISNNKIIGNGSPYMNGISNDGLSLPTITNNIITGTIQGIIFAGGGGMVSREQSIIDGNIIEYNQTGIYHQGISTVIGNNTIRGNSVDGIYLGSYGWGNRPDGSYCCISESTINSNVISGNGRYGVYGSSSNPAIIHNKITANVTGDISVTSWPETTASVGFNIYDIISGSGMVGGYNLKSDGTPHPLP